MSTRIFYPIQVILSNFYNKVFSIVSPEEGGNKEEQKSFLQREILARKEKSLKWASASKW